MAKIKQYMNDNKRNLLRIIGDTNGRPRKKRGKFGGRKVTGQNLSFVQSTFYNTGPMSIGVGGKGSWGGDGTEQAGGWYGMMGSGGAKSSGQTIESKKPRSKR